MNKKQSSRLIKPFALSIFLGLSIAGCGGGSGSSDGVAPASVPVSDSSSTTPAPPVTTPAPLAQDPARAYAPVLSWPVLPTPAAVADGSVVELQCGTIYQGTLNLAGKTNVTVKTAGTCGKAMLTVGQSITGWTRHQGNVYSAPVSFDPVQVMIDAQPITLAHWPNREQTWAKPTASTADSLSHAMPNPDLAGATLVFRPFEWAIEQRRISAYADGTLTLAPSGDLNFDGYALAGTPDFYVEGKLWMLDEPGEWAVSGGRLYVWSPDGQSPEGRTWAAPDQSGIDASDASGIALENLGIFGSANGIRAMGAVNLRVTGTEIVNSSQNGILNSGGRGLTVDNTVIRNSRHDAIAVKWGGGGETITNSRFERSGSIGMPTNAHAAINLTVGVGSTIRNNRVTDSGYIGIRFFRDATVSGNTVDGACLVLTDCGGLYSFAEDGLALNSRIDGNTIRNAGAAQRLAWGIFLDDSANGVTITNNIVTGNGNGMMIHNGFNHTVTGNTFSANRQAHIQMVESRSAGSTRNNAISRNTFISTVGEETYRISSDFGTGSVGQFGSYDFNDYASASAIFANFNGEALDFAQWKSRTGQDGSSTLRAP